MSEERSGGRAPSSSIGSSRGSTWRERRQKRRENRKHPRGEERSGLGEGSDQTHRTVSGVSAHRQYDDRDRELERLRRLVMDLELEARGRCQERNCNLRQRRNRGEEGSSRSGTQRFQNRSHSQESHRHSRETRHHRDRSRSHGYDDRGSESPEERQPHNAAMDAMSRALRMATESPFSDEIERALMPSKFT